MSGLVTQEQDHGPSRDQFRAFVEHAPVGIFRTAIDGRIVLSNRAMAHLLGYPQLGDLLKVHAAELCAVAADAREWLNRISTAGVVQHFQTRLRRYDGSTVWVELNARAIREGDGTVSCYEGVAIDISQRKEAEEALVFLATRVQASLEQTVSSIVAIMERRDPYTAIHQRRVADLAAAISRELGHDDDQARGIYMAALIHDVGKFFVPLEILCCPGKLGTTEMELVRRHVRNGYDILKGVDTQWPLAEAALYHHERLDGTGYPERIGRSDIPLAARILAVADTVEAMAEHRPYRPRVGLDAALREIAAAAGVKYDVDVVGACMRLFEDKGYRFQEGGITQEPRFTVV